MFRDRSIYLILVLLVLFLNEMNKMISDLVLKLLKLTNYFDNLFFRMIDERLILVSLFLPITGHAYLNSSQDDRQPILSSYARTSKKKRVTDSIQSTAPANR